MVREQHSDEDLVVEARVGDERALADLYSRYFGHVYDYAIRLSRDRDVAALVVQGSFLRLFQQLRAGEPPPSFKLALFAQARYELTERLRHRRGPMMEGDEGFAVAEPTLAGSPSLAADLPELARLVWQAARELRPAEYELLDLHIRRGLTAGEVAFLLRVRSGAGQTRLDQALAALEESFSSLVLLSYGRRTCLDLDFLLAEDQWSPALKRRLLQHLSECQTCQETRRSHVGAPAMLGALTSVSAPFGWQQTMFERLVQALRPEGAADAVPAPAPRIAPVPTPTPARVPAPSRLYQPMPAPAMPASAPGMLERAFSGGGARGPLVAVLGGGLLATVIIFAALCGTGAFSGSPSQQATATPTPTASASRTPTATASATATETPRPRATATTRPTETPVAPTATPVPPTATPAPTSLPSPTPTHAAAASPTPAH